jgi:dTDP-glucose 4,6-dehydratase
MKNILVTGGAGFIGSAFVRHMVAAYPQYNIIVYDKMTYAGNLDNLLPVSDEPNYRFEQGDIASRETVRRVFETHAVDTVVNFAAESHVDRSILSPDAFIHSNTVGVHILLDESRQFGIERFVQVSTDEVYGDIEEGKFSLEDDTFLPNSPYAASKAAGELMVRAYHITHGLNTVVTRGSNTFGPYQYPEKLMPFFITEAIDDRPLPVYGDGRQVRDWLYVDDHALGVAAALFHGEAGQAYNIAGEHREQNINVTHHILELLGKPRTLIKHVPDREGHDLRYAMNCDKLKALGWQRQHTFDSAIEATVNWYRQNEWWWRKIKTGEYLEYYKRQYAARLAAADNA